MNGESENNKQAILRGVAGIAAGGYDTAVELLHEDFVNHTPGHPSGREAFRRFIGASPLDGQRRTLRHVVAEDDLVVTVQRVETDGAPDREVVDIFRFADGLVVEHWDVVQSV